MHKTLETLSIGTFQRKKVSDGSESFVDQGIELFKQTELNLGQEKLQFIRHFKQADFWTR